MTGMNILILTSPKRPRLDDDDTISPFPPDTSLVPRGAAINFGALTRKLAEARGTRDSHQRHPSRLGHRMGDRGSILETEKIGKSLPNQSLCNYLSAPDYIRLFTTVATNALLERKGHKHALLITKSFKVLLLTGN